MPPRQTAPQSTSETQHPKVSLTATKRKPPPPEYVQAHSAAQVKSQSVDRQPYHHQLSPSSS